MKSNNIKFSKLLLSVVTILMIVTYSCKKADIKYNNPKEDKETEKLKAIFTKQLEKMGGIPQVFTRNQKVTTKWVDKYHNLVSKEEMQSNNFSSQCNYDLPAFCNLVQYARVYRCGTTGVNDGYFLQFEYELSWNNNITKIAGTACNVNIVDASNTIVKSITLDYTNSDVEIVEIGPDPNPSFPNNYIFRVKFVSTVNSSLIIPAAYINSGNYEVKCSATFGTDCKAGGDPYSLWLLPVTTFGFTGASGNNPCNRQDFVFVNPPGQATNILSVGGFNNIIIGNCTFGSGFTLTDLQEVEYNYDGGNWQPMSNYTAQSFPIGGTAFIRGTDFANVTIPSGDHLIGVRYRNWKYINTNPSGWPIPNLPDDCRSIENTNLPSNQQEYSTFAYSYWLCLNIP